MSRYLSIFLLLFVCTTVVYAQYEGGIAVEDDTYVGHKMVKNKTESKVTPIKQVSLGNGIQVYMDAEKQSYLNGLYFIIFKGGLYTVAAIEKGLLHGECLLYSGQMLWRKMHYHRGLLEGKRTEYYEDGTLKSEVDYIHSVSQRIVKYHTNGQLEETSDFDERGLKHGEVITYSPAGKVIGKENYVHGLLEGEGMRYNRDGLQEHRSYRKGALVGPYRLMHPNGKVKLEGTYNSKSKLTGKWTDYNEDGSLISVIHYDNGVEEGETTYYFRSGAIRFTGTYKQGIKEGIHQEYEESPYRLLSVATYKDGQLDGAFKAYNEGELWRDCLYKEGKLVSEKQYLNGKIHILRMLDESGNLVDVRKYDTTGKSVYKNTKYRKHDSVRLVEDDFGIIDIDE